jgi:tryptophan-rich hypothetical protein
MAAPIHPRHPTHLVGSRWTRNAVGRLRHYEVIAFSKRGGWVEMRPALEPSALLRRPWRELRDREAWLPGWVSVPCTEEEDEGAPSADNVA